MTDKFSNIICNFLLDYCKFGFVDLFVRGNLQSRYLGIPYPYLHYDPLDGFHSNPVMS